MTIRAWTNTFVGLFLVFFYASLYNLFSPQGKWLYATLVVGGVMVWYITIILYRSTDKRQVRHRIKKYNEDPGDVFTDSNYLLASETSGGQFSEVSRIIKETYGKEEAEELLGFVQGWKEENGFIWEGSTVYDRLDVFGTLETDSGFSIEHVNNTKHVKIKGMLVNYIYKDGEGRKDEWGDLYSISGLNFYLTNVNPEDIGKNAVWSISIDVEKTKNNYGVSADIGMVTGLEYL